MKSWELRIERPPMFGKYRVRLLQVFLVVKHGRHQRLRVFRDALGVVFANLFGQVARVTGRRRDRQRWIRRINIDWRNVELKTRMRLLEIKAADPLHRSEEHTSELQS